MTARALILGMVVVAAALGGLLYYLQVYGYYVELGPGDVENVQLARADGGSAVPLELENFKGIDSTSSPIRFRGCFETALNGAAIADLAPYSDAVPLTAPGWFDCFDAAEIGADLESGAAVAVLGQADVSYGIDRVLALYPDGRGYAWHQINSCGEEVFDGNPPPEGCPPAPER